MNPPRIFLDASALFAAAYSTTGAARELLRLGITGDVELVTNAFAVEEALRNIGRKAPDVLPLLEALLATLPITIHPAPSKTAVTTVAEYVELKDAPIVAGAIDAAADFLATFDRRHLLTVNVVAERSGLQVVTPGDILAQLRSN
ncbi:MAG: PIN domain-containing protein [Chloroflexota bacterium]